MPQITAEAQKLSPSAIISLFTLDTTRAGGPVLRFVMSSKAGASIVFQGQTYAPFDVKFEGLETTGIGPFPMPTINVANDTTIIGPLINTYGDLNGCVLTRIRTFARFLDGEPDADPTAFMGPDTYSVDRKAEDTPESVTWELSAAIDQQGKMIPGRQIIASTCLFRYRAWNTASNSFDYSKAQCPYTGSQSYDINDAPVASGALDVPSRRISCCKTRFGQGAALPFGGFPGAAQVS